jgi:hypothetical protein
MTEIKPFAEVNKMLHTKEAEVASKVFSKEEKHDAKEAQKTLEKELKDNKK